MKKNELIRFLILAKRSTYPKYTPNKKENMSKTFSFKKEDWKYLDTYYGSNSFSGIEIVFYKKIPIWSMSYFGTLTHKKGKMKFILFLKKHYCLCQKKISIEDQNISKKKIFSIKTKMKEI